MYEVFTYFKNLDINYFTDKYSATEGADVLVIVTEWKEFRSPNFNKIKENLSKDMIFDGRNQYNAERLNEQGFELYQIGKEKK